MNIGRAHIDLTGRCNQRCKHCHMSEYYKEELSTKKILSLINNLNRLGVKKIAFAGGEPLLREDLFEILKICPRNISILTNATLLNDEAIEKFSDFEKEYDKLITFRISVDGFDAHKKLRGYGSEEVIKIIEKLKSAGFIVVVNTVICPFIEEDELIEMFYLFEKIEVDQWNVDLPFDEGSFKKNELKIDMDFVLGELKKLIVEYFKKDRYIRLDVISLFCSERIKRGLGFYECGFNKSPCDYQFHSITINPKGEILLCPSLHVPFGKIEDLEKYRESEKWKSFVSKNISYPEGCRDCRYLKICGGGCRANALTATGDIWGKDELSCVLMKFLEKELISLYPEKLQKEFKDLLIDEECFGNVEILDYSFVDCGKLILSLFENIYPDWTKDEKRKMCYDEEDDGHVSTKVAFMDGKIIGQSNVFKIRGFNNIANLGYHVHSDYREKGVAFALCGSAIGKAKLGGVDFFVVRTNETNFAAIGLAKKLGFVLVEKDFIVDGNNLGTLRKDGFLIFLKKLG